MDVSSGTVFLKQKGEDWQQMLAQGQSSSPKKKKSQKRQTGHRLMVTLWGEHNNIRASIFLNMLVSLVPYYS